MDGPSSIPNLAHELSDTALALLLSFAAQGHCRFTYDADTGEENPVQNLVEEIAKAARETFGLVAQPVNLEPCTSADAAAIAMGVSIGKTLLPDLIVLRGLQEANEEVAGFIVELMRSRRIELWGGAAVVPGRWFCVVDVVEKGMGHKSKGAARHATDFFFISHHHSVPVDIDVDVTSMVDNESLSSVVIRKAPSMLSLPISSVSLHPPLFPLIAESSILTFRDLASEVVISTEIKRYMHDLTVFLRMHRAIESGCVTARSAREFEVLVKLLAVIHGMDFVTPALVRLAVYKVFSHRLRVIGKGKAERERSVGYGSDVKSVGRYLEGVEEEMVVTDVVDSVKAPL